MADKTPYGIWVDSLIFGVLTAIWYQAGTSVDPQDIMFGVVQDIIQLFSPNLVWIWVGISVLASMVTLFIMLYGIYRSGAIGIVCALFGFFGGFLIIFPSTVTAAIVCIVGGVLLTSYISEHT